MNVTLDKANVILIGCGPHARRVYLPALRQIHYVDLALIVDLESQETIVRASMGGNTDTELWFIKPFSETMPVHLADSLSAFVFKNKITGIIIATEPLVHASYARWALENGLNILIDKPITARAEAINKMTSATGIVEDYSLLLDLYNKQQQEKETIFMVNSHRRFHKGFQFVQKKISEIAEKTNCPVTFIQAYHCDGQWRLPNEIVTQKYHPYCFGYGKASHSGYHIFDTVYQFYKAAAIGEKTADEMEIVSSFIQPNGFFSQFAEADYQSIFGAEYNSVNYWSDEELKRICTDFGELDLSSIIKMKKNGQAIANFSINLIHNGFSGRTWLQPGEDLYKGNGRIKHESYHIQQGPFQNIQIHAYQAYDKHDQKNGLEENLGGKNHFEIHIYRNPLVAGSKKQPEIYKLSDIEDDMRTATDSMVTMEWVKFKVVEEFADYLTGRRAKESIQSQIDDHLVPVQMMSGIYQSHVQNLSCSFDLKKSAVGVL